PVPEDKAFEFQTTVGEKVLLRVEAEQSNEDEWESAFPNRSNQRKHPREEDFPSLGPSNGIAAPHTRPQVKAGQGVQPKSKAFDKTRKEGATTITVVVVVVAARETDLTEEEEAAEAVSEEAAVDVVEVVDRATDHLTTMVVQAMVEA
ncbi:hypothetical protein LTR16_011033, partial [Cryomyces antarcticus]